MPRTPLKLMMLLSILILASQARGQNAYLPGHPRAQIIIPQSRAWSLSADASEVVKITGVEVGVVVLEQVATTSMEISLHNPSRSRQVAELLVPVPAKATLGGFSFDGPASEPTAELLPAHRAARIYDSLVSSIRDPALLEFAGYNLIRTSVFPVEANGHQKLRLTYEHVLPADGDRIDYELPRSESLDYGVPWNVSVRLKSKRPIATVYSPSHKLETVRKSANIVSARIAADATREAGAFRLSYLLEGSGVAASLLTYPDSGGGGYFMLLAGLPAKPPVGDKAVKREVTLVLDRSGSMKGEKIEQVRRAALQVLNGLEPGEFFNILTYNATVDSFSPQPVAKTAKTLDAARQYLAGIQASGGTNIHDALTEALRQEPTASSIPMLLFLTDGLPTVGQTAESEIRKLATEANPYKRRIFAFGVGFDVNTPLLERIAVNSRATAHFVLPKEDVEVKVSKVFKHLSGPVLTSPELAAVVSEGSSPRISEVLPGRLPDLFEDDQLVVLGRYSGDDPLRLRLHGDYYGQQRAFEYTFDLAGATTRNAFVSRLWASRKIGILSDAIRDLGATIRSPNVVTTATNDPRLRELVDEIVAISTKYGILTEYTAFLAREGTDLAGKDSILAEASSNFANRAVQVRSGISSLNQDLNNRSQREQVRLNLSNGYVDENLNRVSVSNVRQVNDRAFFRRNGVWIDSRLADRPKAEKAEVTIEFGSPEFKELVRTLVSESRQGTISLNGDILMLVGNRTVLIRGPREVAKAAAVEGTAETQ